MRRSVLTGASAAAASTQTAVAKPLALAIARQTLPAGGGWASFGTRAAGSTSDDDHSFVVQNRSEPGRGVVSAGQLVGAVHGVEASQHHDFSGRP